MVPKKPLLAYGIIVECNWLLIQAAGVVPSFVEELLLHRAETGGIDSGLLITIEVQRLG